MAVSLSVIEAARKIFQDGFDREAQQLMSRFRGFADVKTGITGKTDSYKVYRKGSDMQIVTGRLQDTNPEEAAYRYRYLFPKKGKKATIFDEDDGSELGLSVAPTGDEIREHMSSAARFVDDTFIAGILGDAYEGSEESVQTVAFDSNQVVAVNYREDGGSANLNLTKQKILRAKGKFSKAEVIGQDQSNPGKLCMAVSTDELHYMLNNDSQLTSADFNSVQALIDGTVDQWLGVKFIRSERLPYTTVGATSGAYAIRTCPMWISNGVRLSFWADLRTNIDRLPTKDQAIQIFSRIRLQAGRKDEDRVVKVLCEYAV